MLEDFVNRFELNQSIWDVVAKAHQKYQLGLLTNQYPRMLNLVKMNSLIPNIDWDVEIDSSIVGYQKPEEEIYKIALSKTGLKPDKLLFIDNSPEHVEAAKKQGWNAFLYDHVKPELSSNKLAELLSIY